MNRTGIVHSVMFNVVRPRLAPNVYKYTIGRVLKTCKYNGLPVALLIYVWVVIKREAIGWIIIYHPYIFLIHRCLKQKILKLLEISLKFFHYNMLEHYSSAKILLLYPSEAKSPDFKDSYLEINSLYRSRIFTSPSQVTLMASSL